MAPSNPSDAYGLLRSAIDDPDPVIFIENLPTYFTKGEAPESGHRVPIGKANIVHEGSDVTIITYARMVQEGVLAAEALAKRDISVELIDLRSIAPWDRETVLASVKKTGRALVVHEAVTPFGAGAEISSVIHENLFHTLKAPVRRLGAAFCPVPFSRPLEAAFAPDAAAIEAAAAALLA